MERFITAQDYDASIHREILDAISREDEAIIKICEDRAIADIRQNLADRFDCNQIFSAMGADRHPLVLMYAIDIAIYHLFSAHNPQKLSQLRKDRYERAIRWAERVGEGKISSEGLLSTEAVAEVCPYQIRSNPKRNNHR